MPDLTRKYEITQPETTFKVSTEPRNIGDKQVGPPEPISPVSYSGVIAPTFFSHDIITNPTAVTTHKEDASPAKATATPPVTTHKEDASPAKATATTTTLHSETVQQNGEKQNENNSIVQNCTHR